MKTVDSPRTRQGAPMLWAFVIAVAAAISGLAFLLQRSSANLAPGAGGYSVWDGNLGSTESFLLWFLSAVTEPNFYTSALAGVGLLVGGAFSHMLFRRNGTVQGFVQACGSGIWPWALASALLGVLLSNLLWGWTLAATHSWQPLFVPFVSVAPTVVLMFGASIKNVLTGAGLGALLTTPFSLIGTNWVCAPLGLPPVIGVTGGMAVGAVMCFLICRILPWMPPPLHLRQQLPALPPTAQEHEPQGTIWTLRRALADFSEAQFFGNEWASAGLVLGAIASYLLNPNLPAYGTGLLPAILSAQVITALVAVVFWRRQWASRPFFPTFVPVVSVAPAVVLAFGGSWQSIVVGAVLGAIMAPPIAAGIARRLPSDFHPFIGNVASMAISTAIIVPVLGLVPGFIS